MISEVKTRMPEEALSLPVFARARRWAGLAALLLLWQCAPRQSPEVRLQGQTMGTSYHIKLLATLSDAQKQSLQQKIDQNLAAINLKMSTYLPDSELSRFNRFQKTGWFDLSEETARVIARALEVSRLSGGMYDITVGPLVNLWGFGPQPREQVPSASQIKEALARVGYQKVEVELEPPRVRKQNRGVYLDLSSIAKGYAVDQVALLLEQEGIQNYMVEIGGEVRTGGKNPNRPSQKWTIAIESPLYDEQKIELVLSVSGQSVATSGDYRNFFKNNQIVYSHTIDPRSGYPVQNKMASVTVIAANCTDADAFATAIMALGADRGYELALAQKLPVLIMVRQENSWQQKFTPEFEQYIGQQPK